MPWNIVSATTIELAAGMVLSTRTVAMVSMVTATGVGVALFGANCPAGTLSSPIGWLKIVCPDGALGYIPVWR